MTSSGGVPSHAHARPDAAAIVAGSRTYTYRELDSAAARLAALSSRDGPIAAMLPNSAEYLIAGIAAAYAQVPFVPVNWHLKADEVAWILADSGATVFVVTKELKAQAERARSAVPNCRMVVVEEEQLPDAVRPADAWLTPQWMFYTSGTTGRPKGVVHGGLDPAAMVRSQLGLCALWGFTADDVYALSGPGYHAGPGGYAFTTLFAGGAVVVQSSWRAEDWFAIVERCRVTTTFLTPAHFIRLLEAARTWPGQRPDLSSLRLVIHGGAPCPAGVKRAIIELLAPAEVAELYGASEGGATRITTAEWRARPGSVGRPWPGVEIVVRDRADGHVLPAGAAGLIYVRPAGGARFHYHRDDEKTAAAWVEDAFTVGDIGHLDEDGYLYITDRASDMVIWGGTNIYPREVEDVLFTHPAVLDCAVVGVPDERFGERLAAVVELRRPALAEELRDHVRDRIADFKVPETIIVVDAVPRDPNGKVRKPMLRSWIAAGCPAAGAPARVVS